jgi:7-carboxy-7-deazaguanine synthase
MLAVSEIFLSIQGESSRAGLPCVLVRLAGCNLRCAWCDTQYAWTGGREMGVEEVLAKVGELACRRVEVTGGEPLCQAAAPELLRRLADAGYETLLETNGSQDIRVVDERVVRIVDFKCPSSGEAAANCWANAGHLTARDEVKFVLADRADYEFARRAVAEHGLPARCGVIFSPVHGRLDPAALARWVLADGLDVRLGVQLHKVIWPDRARGV